ncbi:unnamed protein product [Cercopithifilaria johnstoni]|uniref:Uncharacterized protein n=1 Tax=Cercopithifilaria johnstoni TaxID=2874296 RepID=A0A8J2LS20_9BILA|nr:unnamed protein product [Cercopithifilaria johnstoni]
MTDIHIRMNVNNTDNIHTTVINKRPISMLTQEQQYRHNGYVGGVIIDLTDNDSSKVTKVESTEIQERLQSNKKFSNFFIDKNKFHSGTYTGQSREQLFRSNTEIFNQILKVRKDIDGLRREIRKVKEFVQHMNSNISKYDTNAMQQFDKATLTDNSKDDNFRSHQFANGFWSKRNMYNNAATEPNYIVFPRTESIMNPMLVSRLQANAAAPALKNENLKSSRWNQDGDNVTNSTKLPVKFSFESDHELFLNEERIIESSQNGQLFPSAKSGNTRNGNLFVANESNEKSKCSNALININERCDEIGKILQKSTNYDHGIKNETLMDKEQKLFQLQPTTSAKFQLLVTILSPSSKKEISNISVTEAYQPFSITRYTARSKINFDKEINKLTNFNRSKPVPITHQFFNPVSVTLISGHKFSHATQLPSYLPSSTENPSLLEFGNNSNPIILSFASPIASKTSGHATANRSSFLLSSTTVSNTISTIVTSTVSTIATTTITTTTTTTTTTTITTTIMTTTTIISSTSETVRPTLGFNKIPRHNLDTMPPLIPLKPNFFGSTFNGIFVPWFNGPQLTLWPEGLFRRG